MSSYKQMSKELSKKDSFFDAGDFTTLSDNCFQ
jgi:hypothetical protein